MKPSAPLPARRKWALTIAGLLAASAIAVGAHDACTSPHQPSSLRATLAAQSISLPARDAPAIRDVPGGLQAAVKTTPRHREQPARSRTTFPRVERRELSLLAELERDLGGEPPPDVHALLAAHRRGASHADLVERVRQTFPPDLALRALTLRWLDRAFSSESAVTGRARPRPEPSARGRSWVASFER
jgi:hypothetical protein